MSMSGWVAGAGLRRAAVETGLLALVLVLPLAAVLQPAIARSAAQGGAPEGISPVLGIGMVYAGHFGALLGAIRLYRAGGGIWARLRHEFAGVAALLLGVWTGAALAHSLGAAWVSASASLDLGTGDPRFAAGIPEFALVSAVGVLLAYPLCRVPVLVWPVWDQLRRTRLLWALTHAQLVAALILAAGVSLVSMVFVQAGRIEATAGLEALPEGSGAAAVTLAWLTTRLFPALTELLVLAAAAAALLLPPAALISYLVLRRTTGRLEQLAEAAGALRSGNLSARVQVGGEDEAGRLQADFNAMADELERTLHELQGERDRVAGLLDSRRQLIANVSHELRTPLATVRGYLEAALRREKAETAQLRADLEVMEREVERLERMIEDLFTLSRAEVGRLALRLESVDAGEIARRIVGTAAPLAWHRHKVELVAEAEPGLPPARADGARLEQIVSNLVGNAVRHTPPGGVVAVAVAAGPDTVRVEVSDSGEGIAPEDLPFIFDRFYRGTAARERDGAGLGLALVKELAEAMGGSVEAASTPGEGSCFTVRLPRD